MTTLDGSAVGADGRSGTVNTPADNRVFALQRALCDAVLVGSGTARAEGYERLAPTRRRASPPALVVVSGGLAAGRGLPWSSRRHLPGVVACMHASWAIGFLQGRRGPGR